MKIEVTTASKQAQSLTSVPAAIYVVTQDDIRRSGVTSIPEALRMVPGVQVARSTANQWVVTIRGFEGRYANKLLVLIDGRSVYSPLFSGVNWDAQIVNMDDIDRIEVIRGPGGSLWGANAVNGIINIITKSAEETQGNTASVRTSTDEPENMVVQHGGKFGPQAFYRVYAKLFNVASLNMLNGDSAQDKWRSSSAGFRTDWSKKSDAFSFSGSYVNSNEGETQIEPLLTPPYSEQVLVHNRDVNWNLVGRWERSSGYAKGTALQISYDHVSRLSGEITERRDNLRLDFQQPLRISSTNNLIWGLGYYSTKDHTVGSDLVIMNPQRASDTVYSGFVQDEIQLRNHLQLSVGTKVEHNSYTGWEFQPSGRVSWTPSSKQTLWASVSRAVRTPNRIDADSTVNYTVLPGDLVNPPIQTVVFGNKHLKSESVIAQELGWRYIPSAHLSIDVAVFYNKYDRLLSTEIGTPFMDAAPFPHLIVPITWGNKLNAETHGLEISGQYQAAANWRLNPAITIYSARYFLDQGSTDPNNASAQRKGSTPNYQFSLRSLLDLPNRMQFDTSLYYVDKVDVESVAPYARLDVRLGWNPNRLTTLSVGAQNLLTLRHREAFTSGFEATTLVERSFFLSLNVRF